MKNTKHTTLLVCKKRGGQSITITNDPLAKGSKRWFEDYFDYTRDFVEIYKQAKIISNGWAMCKDFNNIKILDVSILNSLEHTIHSFWIQVLRDRYLVKGIIEKENPVQIYGNGSLPDIINISECRFDPGLFEYTLRDIAEKYRVDFDTVLQGKSKRLRIKKPSFRDITGSFSARAQAVLRRVAVPKNDIILISRQVKDKLGGIFLKAVSDADLTPVCIDHGPSADCLAVWDIVGSYVDTKKRLTLYYELVDSIKSIPENAWSDQFTIEECIYGAIAKEVVYAILSRVLWGQINILLLCNKLFMAKKPLALLVLYDHGIHEAPVVSLAKQNGIKTITFQHGLICRDVTGYLPICSDYFACWGQEEKKALIEQGAPADKLKVTGNPLLEKALPGNLSIKPISDPIKVLIATQGVQSTVGWYHGLIPTERLILALKELGVKPNKYVFTIRLHPNENLSQQAQQLARSSNIKISAGRMLCEDIEESDVVAVQYSTVGAEALISGKPLVSFNWLTDKQLVPFAESGAAVFSRSPADFLEAIDKALVTYSERQEAIKKFVYNHLNQGSAAIKLLDLCR